MKVYLCYIMYESVPVLYYYMYESMPVLLLLYTWMCVQMKMYIHCTYTCKHAADYRKYK